MQYYQIRTGQRTFPALPIFPDKQINFIAHNTTFKRISDEKYRLGVNRIDTSQVIVVYIFILPYPIPMYIHICVYLIALESQKNASGYENSVAGRVREKHQRSPYAFQALGNVEIYNDKYK